MTNLALARRTAPVTLRRVEDPLRQAVARLGQRLPRRADATVLLDFLEDDLREGLDALVDVEAHFTQLLTALQPGAVSPAGLLEAGDEALVLKRLDALTDVVTRVRRRMNQAAGLMRQPPTT